LGFPGFLFLRELVEKSRSVDNEGVQQSLVEALQLKSAFTGPGKRNRPQIGAGIGDDDEGLRGIGSTARRLKSDTDMPIV
jgi:hypothetical protein